MLRLLEAEGYGSTDQPEEADLILINTCSVREKPEQKVRSLLGKRAAQIDQIRRQMQTKALLQIWLYVHVPLTIALLRVYELQQPQALPVLDEYVGCKSWVELGQDLPLGYLTPVLTDQEYDERAEVIRRELGATPSAV